MALELRPSSNWWYGRFFLNGKRLCINLGVEVRGQRPADLRQQGDNAFERSRGAAQAQLAEHQREAKKKKSQVEMIQKVHEIRMGERINSVLLQDFFSEWKAVPRKRPLSTRYEREAESRFVSFLKYLGKTYPAAKEMADIQSSIAEAYMKHEEARGVSPKTYNNVLILLRSAFTKLGKKAGLAENPFEGLPTREENTTFREPFSIDELAEIYELAKEDDFIRPIIVVAMCTAMRKGDCCNLKKSAINLESRYVNVKTSKTGKDIQIPMFPLLYEELKDYDLSGPGEFLFSKQASMYASNPDGILYRVRKILKEVGFTDGKTPSSEKGAIRSERKIGLRRASIRDFHSFRVSWVTLALTSGVPLELVKKVTGHGTVDIVLKHYFQPGKDDFRKALESKMPSLLTQTGDEPSEEDLKEKIHALAENLSSKNWKKTKAKLLKILQSSEPTTIDS